MLRRPKLDTESSRVREWKRSSGARDSAAASIDLEGELGKVII